MELVRIFNPKRVGLLDEVRGFCLLLMVLYHGAYDIIYIFGYDIPAFHWRILDIAQPVVAGTFIFISGVCCRYSRDNLKRGLMALGVGVAMTLFTLWFMRDQLILFGILHFLGCAMILFAMIHTFLDKLPVFPGIAVMAALFVLAYGIPHGWLGLPGPLRIELPDALYGTSFLFPLGLKAAMFQSADYFPLLPWIFCFFAGSYLGVSFVQQDMPSSLYKSRSPFLAGVGRHSLLIYILHQPVVYGLLMLLLQLRSLLL